MHWGRCGGEPIFFYHRKAKLLEKNLKHSSTEDYLSRQSWDLLSAGYFCAVCMHDALTWLQSGCASSLPPSGPTLHLCCWPSLRAEPACDGYSRGWGRKAYLETSSHVFFRRWMALLCRAERMA